MSRDDGQDLEALDDEELFQRWIASRRDRAGSGTPIGDEHAFGLLWCRHHLTSLRIIEKGLGRAHRRLAEEVNQDTWAEVVRAFSWVPDPGKKNAFARWLGKVARNKARDARERRYLEFEVSDPDDGDGLGASVVGSDRETPEARLDRKARVEACRRAALALPPGQVEVLDLYATKDMTAQEVADHLGLPHKIVRSRLAHAKRNLKRKVRLDAPHSAPTTLYVMTGRRAATRRASPWSTRSRMTVSMGL